MELVEAYFNNFTFIRLIYRSENMIPLTSLNMAIKEGVEDHTATNKSGKPRQE
jgi:hypothetical protein